MTYTPSPDASSDTLVNSRDTIRGNFEIIRDDFAVDHSGFNDGGAGKHNKSTYLELVNPNQPTTLADESAIWAIQGPDSGETELYIRRESSTGVLQVPTKDLAIFGVAAAGLFDGTDNVNNALGTHNVNMTAVRTATGRFTCTFTNPMLDANYMVAICAQSTTAGTNADLFSWRINTKAAGSMQIIFSRFTGGNATRSNPTSWSAIVYGGIQ